MIKLPHKVCGMAFPDLLAQLVTDPWLDDQPRILLTASRTFGNQTNSHSIVIDNPDSAEAFAEEIMAAAQLMREIR